MPRDLRIDRSSAALVVIDLQKGIALDPELRPYGSELVIRNAVSLVEAFRQAGMPVFLVRVELRKKYALTPPSDLPPLDPLDSPPGFADFVDQLVPTPEDIVITKHNWGAFYGTELDLQLRRRGIRTIVLCGVATDFGVESTARYAYELGYAQVFAEDAMASASDEQHLTSIDYTLKRLGLVRSTADIVAAIK